MCRIFGFRSVLKSRVHRSLMGAENALVHQSRRHPDGWGVAWYTEGSPHVIKSVDSAFADTLFNKVSGVMSSQAVVAHVRKATVGEHTVLNSHPFQYGRWIFAHNGNMKNFSEIRQQIKSCISADYCNYIMGNTDSELLFYLLMTELSHIDTDSAEEVFTAVGRTIDRVSEIAGDMNRDEKGDPLENYYTFILTDGEKMIGYQGGQSLHFSTHKERCGERDNCIFFNDSCEAPVKSGAVVNHLMVASEPLLGENVWQKMPPGEMVYLDSNYHFFRRQIR